MNTAHTDSNVTEKRGVSLVPRQRAMAMMGLTRYDWRAMIETGYVHGLPAPQVTAFTLKSRSYVELSQIERFQRLRQLFHESFVRGERFLRMINEYAVEGVPTSLITARWGTIMRYQSYMHVATPPKYKFMLCRRMYCHIRDARMMAQWLRDLALNRLEKTSGHNWDERNKVWRPPYTPHYQEEFREAYSDATYEWILRHSPNAG